MGESILALLQLLSGVVPDSVKPILGGLVLLWILYSLFIDWLNARVREAAEKGMQLSKSWLKVLAILNVPALNAMKAKQLWDGYRGTSVSAMLKK